jgi:plastocyanin
MRARTLLIVLALGTSLTACSKDATSSADKVALEATETTCMPATTAFTSGDSITFAVTNNGKDVTEVYVYGKGSSGEFDQVVGEVENIAPSTSRDLTVTLTAGDYQVTCKPGQKGSGIRTLIEVAGEAANPNDSFDSEVKFVAQDNGFFGLGGFTPKLGDRIKFQLINGSASKQHEFEVFGPDGKPLGEVGPTDPAKDGEVIIEFKTAGTYTYESGIADDKAKGLKGSFTVS